MSNQTNLNQFFKSSSQMNLKRKEQNNDQTDSNSQSMIREEENEEYSKRQYTYILPSDVPQLWQKMEDKLKLIKERRCQLSEIINIIKNFIQIHFAQRKKVINASILEEYFDTLSKNKMHYYQNDLLPFMAGMALQIKNVFQDDDSISLLLQGEQLEQKFSKFQIVVLLCNMFFCTLHEQPSTDSFPKFFDFSRLYLKGTVQECNNLKVEKLKFLFNYFSMVQQDKINLDLCVSFERVNQYYKVNYLSKQIPSKKMCDVHVFDDKTIESGQNLIQVTFANKLIGGGVLNKGALQEEIRYLISPECLVGLLLFEELDANESIIIQGAQQVSDYSGYGNSLKFVGEYIDDSTSIQESNNMLNIVIVGMDATNFNDLSQDKLPNQYQIVPIMKDILKAYSAFAGSKNVIPFNKATKKGVITGNWGCGDFGGDKELKFLIQWIAASWAERTPLYYCTYQDSFLKTKIEEVLACLYQRYNLGEIISILRYYIRMKVNFSQCSLFDYITSYVN